MNKFAIKHKVFMSGVFSMVVTFWTMIGNLSGLNIAKFNIYISDTTLMMVLLVAIILSSGSLMVTIPNKRMNLYELFLNCALPVLVHYSLKIIDYSLIPVIMFLCISVLGIIFIIYLQKQAKVRKMRTVYYARHIIAISAFVFLIPTYICYKYDDRALYEYFSEPNDVVEYSLNNEWEKEVVDKVQNCNWKKLDSKERSDIVHEVLKYEATLLGIELPRIYIDTKESEFTRGSYNHIEKTIKLNVYYLGKDDIEDVLKTALHELFHSYEHSVIDIINAMPDENWKSNRYFKQAIEWKTANENYAQDQKKLISYEDNQLEVDARAYADETVKKYLNSE